MYTNVIHQSRSCPGLGHLAMLTRGLIISISLLTFGSGISAQEPDSPVIDLNSEPVLTPVNEEGMADGLNTDIRLELLAFNKGCTIPDALKVLNTNYKKNIVPSANVNGAVNFTKLQDVTLSEALDAVLGPDFVCEEEGNIIRVFTKDEYTKRLADPARMIHRVFTLYYISAAEAENLLEPILSEAGTIKVSTPAETTVPTGESISGGANGGDSLALNDRIIVLDYPENIADVETLLQELDVRPKQVLVEATILSAKLTEQTEFGIDWQQLLGGTPTTGITSAVTNGFATSATGLTIGLSLDNARAVIDALETTTDVTLLANPKIMAVNKQLGQVYIGEKIGYRGASSVGVGGTSLEGEVEFLDTGTKLSFRPYIGNDGYIRMDIHPKDSTGAINATTSVPDETSTELATNILVKDGQTIIIGGLFRNQVTSGRNQVPILGNLPLVGVLFRGTTDTTIRQEVVVMLTPHILDEPDQGQDPEAVADAERRQQAAKDRQQTFARNKMEQTWYVTACRFYMDGDMENALLNCNRALQLCPTYLDAIRLKESIMAETDPDAFARLDRNLRKEVEWQLDRD